MSLVEPGTTLGQRYTLDTSIASGGMGDVWEATDTVLERPVAVKVLRPADPDDTTFIDRFRDEARGSAGLHHPNIAAVYDYGEEDDVAYIVMELVPGRTLGELIRESDGGMAPDDVRSILGQAALALSAAHEAGVVHRDVKPANIIVTGEGQAKLTDFGIARIGDGSGHTRAGEVLGTPDYISPEQALGEPATAASDIYSLGIVAHEMLTGLKPFDMGTPVATALAQVNDPPPPLPDTVPQDLRDIVGACLAKTAADRPHAVSEVAAAVGMPLGALPGVTPAPLGASDATAPIAALSPTRAFTAAHPRTDASAGVGAAGAAGAAGAVGAAVAGVSEAPTHRGDTPSFGERSGAGRGSDRERRAAPPRWAWLAVPLVLLIAWGSFALGGRMGAAPDPAPSTPAVTSTGGAGASTSASTPTTTSTPTESASTSTTEQSPKPPDKKKGKGKGKGQGEDQGN
ncbi:serine/threonine-protein kinase [Intrasporangium sp. YIM S08009]|uniref:serine/threonine-protein kinase n=1 Tax=Intrasporangium zincisolvens TaxID=3080018 RepID=UPI002B061D6D|nr:protein kinase [Intrasporangium sp. YIM S08009]